MFASEIVILIVVRDESSRTALRIERTGADRRLRQHQIIDRKCAD